eukprot:TRINITY_DN17457_c0_g1_i1.p1 TRINITY_DN17457_c0_g1~~TRINITY_DN17457_c0_g1_i1.p1  ORF type:complete len:406 (-),score=88.96 TRINITY_DN17457_c0_g1_i1:628-1845(-)
MDLTTMSERDRADTIREAKILAALRHPNIIRFREVYKTKKGRLCLVMDYADGGDLSKRIAAQKGVLFPESKILDWFTQLCLALKHVHDRKIIHRDLKSGNVFITGSDVLKLGDFGIAKVLDHTRHMAKTLVGTPYYLSPEIIEAKPYSFKSDVWSLGVLLYELIALRPPFTAENLHFLALKIVRGAYPPLPVTVSSGLKSLVESLLKVDPAKRPTVNEILRMPLIQRRIKDFLSESQRLSEFSHTILHKQVFVDLGEERQPVQKQPKQGQAKEVQQTDKGKAKKVTSSAAPRRESHHESSERSRIKTGSKPTSRQQSQDKQRGLSQGAHRVQKPAPAPAPAPAPVPAPAIAQPIVTPPPVKVMTPAQAESLVAPPSRERREELRSTAEIYSEVFTKSKGEFGAVV